ncbi:MAG: IS1595 family transposase [Candidatus Thiodiazotropha sp. (ex Lucinoma aequizonata)]|nr:IS1595 family transposase [Candidatus Thiodiazotropha sp. (ex Lucinoma aequizonata)]MCU7902642.1 IS1595 family transposase [Candidatus Thiodiazotropha sp. (ex Lucinoma aequizonata)]MCU7907860.1 IS1595 family transposase [Candidatus Thiodiazotropha sp. (ex Lucinoma aequizonata)]
MDFVCPKCSYTHHCLLNTNQLYQCYHCHHQTSLTSGTIFADTKLPLTTWFLSMFLVTQTKNGISALELMRHLGVSYCIAWSIKHKLMQVMKEREDAQLLDGIIQMDDAY